MKDPKDTSTIDWVEASALKNEKGELEIPLNPENLLKYIVIHAQTEGRNPVDLIDDIHDALCFWIINHDAQKNSNNTTQYTRGLN